MSFKHSSSSLLSWMLLDECKYVTPRSMAAIMGPRGDKHKDENKHIKNEELEQWKKPVSWHCGL